MREVNVRDARAQLAELLDAVEAGEDITIVRRGTPIARVVRYDAAGSPFPDRSGLRESLPETRTSAAETVRALREERG